MASKQTSESADSSARTGAELAGVPDDQQLSERGADIPGAGDARVLIIACGALAREILAVLRINEFQHVDLACLPALLHNTPEQIPDALRHRIGQARRDGYRSIAVAYADCGTGGGIDQVCEEERVERIAGPHCYAFFDGLGEFEAHSEHEIGAFYLTDFLVRQFETIVWRGLGLDRHPELRDIYFGNYDRVVYLAQTDDPTLTAAAQRAAEKLGLAFDRRLTGYGDLADFLESAARPR